MAKSTVVMTPEKSKKDIETLIAKANALIKANKLQDYYELMPKLDEAEKKYAELKATAVYTDLAKLPMPIIEAIKAYSYEIVRHKETTNKETHKVESLELVEKTRQIDLLKFCKHAKLDTDWQYPVQKFNQLLCLRSAKELKYSASEIKQVVDKYFLDEQARKIEMGETPDSNTQICKQCQRVIDGIIFNDDGKGNNTYKCNNHDIAYLIMCYTKKGKERLGVKTAQNDFLRRLIMDICYRILTNGRYTVEFKIKNDKKTVETNAEAPATANA